MAEETALKATPTGIVNSDGSFAANWKDSLPEDIRGEKCLDVVTDFPNAIKQLVNAQKAIGRNRVAIPGDKSTPEEVDAFYAAIGRPKVADDYKVEVVDDLKEMFSEEQLAQSKKLAHSIGLTQKQYEAIVKAEMERVTKAVEKFSADEDARKLAAEDELKKRFGRAYDERMQMANKLVREAIPADEARMLFLEKYGNDPDIIEFVSTVGARLSEGKARIAELTTDTPAEAKAKIAEIQKDPAFLNGTLKRTNPAEHQKKVQQLRELHKLAYPETEPARREVSFGG